MARRLERAGSPPRQIWIDAVCINQSDGNEKMQQIGRMAEIYRLARQVIVWLGPGHAPNHNDAAIALFPLLSQMGKAAVRYMMDSRQPEPGFSDATIPDASSPSGSFSATLCSMTGTLDSGLCKRSLWQSPR